MTVTTINGRHCWPIAEAIDVACTNHRADPDWRYKVTMVPMRGGKPAAMLGTIQIFDELNEFVGYL